MIVIHGRARSASGGVDFYQRALYKSGVRRLLVPKHNRTLGGMRAIGRRLAWAFDCTVFLIII